MKDPDHPRVAVVTGAATGIGRATAELLAGVGYSVAVCDVDAQGAHAVALGIRERGREAIDCVVDVGDASAVAVTVESISARLGVPNAVVCAAGVMKVSPFLDLNDDAWARTLRINLTGTFITLQACARAMVRSAVPGAMVAVSSVAARGPRADASDYAASKAGVVSVAQSAAVALAPHRIRVNAVCPGMVDTLMTQRNLNDRAVELQTSPDDVLAGMLGRVPLGRLASPVEIGGVIVDLLSDRFSYVTGQALNVDGGLEFD